MTEPPAGRGTGPIAETARIDAIDVLRGVALLGILLMNVQSFAMPYAAYFNPTAYGDLEGAKRASIPSSAAKATTGSSAAPRTTPSSARAGRTPSSSRVASTGSWTSRRAWTGFKRPT